MNKKMFVEDFVVSIILAIIFLFIDFRISTGIVFGFIFSVLNYKVIEYRFNNLEVVNAFTYLGAIFSVAILVFPLFVSFLLPKVFSWIGVMIGLMINKGRLILEAVLNK